MREVFPDNRPSAHRIEYPYMPVEGVIEYVGEDDELMRLAREYARRESLDETMPNCSVVVKDGMVLGLGANGSNYHNEHGCERVRLNMPTGEGYELCEGCHPKNHGEPRAIADALYRHDAQELEGAVVYLWGHWWCCEPCWDSMLSHGISIVRLVENSEVLFNKQHPDNVIGRQFDY